ncbi:hypothetical protein, partial [Paenibacillus pasadenensis]|uniref:hypothetical protein n=1 Tax=Paenibacillus pasadenensis TaxID=217090 RepID=UPI003F804E75
LTCFTRCSVFKEQIRFVSVPPLSGDLDNISRPPRTLQPFFSFFSISFSLKHGSKKARSFSLRTSVNG